MRVIDVTCQKQAGILAWLTGSGCERRRPFALFGIMFAAACGVNRDFTLDILAAMADGDGA